MALTVEDGTIVAGADSYNTLAEITTFNDSYLGASAWSDLSGDTAAQERHARLATQATDGRDWSGRAVSATQALDWPRYGVYVESYLLGSDSIPQDVKTAHAYLAIQSAVQEAAGGSLIPVQTVGGGLTLDRIKTGDVELEQRWQGSGSRAGTSYPFVTNALRNLVGTPGILKRVLG